MQVESEKDAKYQDRTEAPRPFPWKDPRILFRYKLRRIVDKLVVAVTLIAVAIVLYPLLNILFMFFYRGALAISLPRLTNLTGDLQPGLANSIVGTLLLISISTLVAVPLGVLGGIYLAEFSGRGKWSRTYADTVRFLSDVLSGMPSILLGYVGFLILVIDFGWGFSPMAGGLILAILMLPYVIKTTELSIRKVPLKLREAATALGATKTQLVNRMSFPLALPGILTGIILSISISIGETAPLIFTVGNSDYYSACLTHCSTSFLTNIIWYFVYSPNSYGPNLAYLSAFLLISFALVLNITARIGLRRLSKI
jgi:phosphate transport system permease protein